MTTVEETYIENRHRIMPNQTNTYDTAHGGIVMKLMDEVGGLAAMRLAGVDCVTARVQGLNFERPIPRGEVAAIEAWVFEAGTSSVRVRLLVDRVDPHTGERDRTCDSVFVYVAVDGDGNPVEVPDLRVESDRDEELRAAGLQAQSEQSSGSSA